MTSRLGCPSTGASLLETMVAVALAGLLTASAASHAAHAARLLAEIQGRWHALTVVSNILEAELGAPCSGLASCPDELVCTVAEGPGLGPSPFSPVPLARVTARAAFEQDPTRAAASLSAIVPRDGACLAAY